MYFTYRKSNVFIEIYLCDAVAVSILYRKVNDRNVNGWTELKKIFKHFKSTKSLKICLGSKASLELNGFADAD